MSRLEESSWFTEDELHTVEPPPWLIEGMLPLRSICMLFGESNVGKTFLALDLAAHISIGKPWLGRGTEEGDVLYIASEGDPGNLGLRMEAWREHTQTDYPVPMLFYTNIVNLVTDAKDLVEEAVSRGLRPRLVVVDTLAMALADNENDNQVMNDMVKALRQLQTYEVDGEEFEMTWLLVHHTGWEKGRPRGGSGMPAGLDSILALEQLTETTCKLHHYKSKNAAKFLPIGFAEEEVAESMVLVPMSVDDLKKTQKQARDTKAGQASALFAGWLDSWPDDVEFSRQTYQDYLKKNHKLDVASKAISEAFTDHMDLIEFSRKDGRVEMFRKSE